MPSFTGLARDSAYTSFNPAPIGNLQGLTGIGRQEQDGIRLEFRFAFLEDGGRLVYLGLLAPEAIGSTMEPIWKSALDSFILDYLQGQTVAIA